MPENIFRGNLGRRELELYGKNNWYDWSCKNWGTKWNARYVEVYDNSISFETAWSPCSPVISALAKQFPEAEFYYRYEESGVGFCGAEEYREGKPCYIMTADMDEACYFENDEYFEEDDEFPIAPADGSPFLTTFVPAQTDVDSEGRQVVGGLFYHREYADGHLIKRINGIAVYRDKEPECWY